MVIKLSCSVKIFCNGQRLHDNRLIELKVLKGLIPVKFNEGIRFPSRLHNSDPQITVEWNTQSLKLNFQRNKP